MKFWLTFLVIAECLSRVNGCTCQGKVLDDHCYEIHESPTLGWVSADETCQSTGGHLAIFLNESQTQRVIQYLETVLTIPVLTGIVVANAQTQRLAAICPNNSYYGLIPNDLSQELVDSNFTNTDRCTFLGPPDFKLTFADCNSTISVLCDRPMIKKDYCNSLATCDNETTIGATLWTTTIDFEDVTENSTDTQNSTTTKTTLLTSMLSVASMNGSSSTATPTIISTVMTDTTATATTPLTNSTKTITASKSIELLKTTDSFLDSTTPDNFTNPFDFGNSTTENSTITTTLLVNGSTISPINATIGANGSSTTTTNGTTTSSLSKTTALVNSTTSTTSTTTTTTLTSSSGTVNSTITTTATTTSAEGNTTRITITLSTGSSNESCQSGGVEIWGWCIPWWLLALLGLLLLLLLCCAFMWCLCGARKSEKRAVVPKISIGVQAAVKQNPIASPEPILVKEMLGGHVRLPIDTDDKATMTDFDPDIRVKTVIEERIKEVEKVIYEPASDMQLPPQPISPKVPQPDPIDIPINIDIHTRRFEDIYRTEHVKEERHIVEVPKIDSKAIKEEKTFKVVDVIDTAVSPFPQPESTLTHLPLFIEPHSPMEWKFNNKLPKDMGAFDSDIDDELIEENLPHRFVPTKKSHESPGKSKRKQRRERDLEIGEEPRNIEQTPHRFIPKNQMNVLKTSERPWMKREKTKSRPRQSEPDVLKIGTPMSRDSKPREDPQRVPRGAFDDISKRPTLSNRSFRDDNMLGRSAKTHSLDPPRRNRRQISPAGNMFSNISRSSSDPKLKNPYGRLGGIVGPEAKGWKPWAKQPKSFSDKPIFLDYD